MTCPAHGGHHNESFQKTSERLDGRCKSNTTLKENARARVQRETTGERKEDASGRYRRSQKLTRFAALVSFDFIG